MDYFSTQNIILFAIIFLFFFIVWIFNRKDIKNSINKSGIDSKELLEDEGDVKVFKGLVVMRYLLFPVIYILYWNSTVSVSDKRITYTLSPVTSFIRISIYFKEEPYSFSLKGVVKSKSGRSITLRTSGENMKIFSFNKDMIENMFTVIQGKIKTVGDK